MDGWQLGTALGCVDGILLGSGEKVGTLGVWDGWGLGMLGPSTMWYYATYIHT
jgi:hypothetical protein